MITEPCFYYEKNQLYVQDIPVKEIIEDVGSPAYIYSEKSFEIQLNKLKKAFEGVSTIICYAIKGNHNVNIIKHFAENGCGADIVSGGELYRAKVAGVDTSKIVYSGVRKNKS